eukprot:COSAG01_NODE_1089_length_11778_cov_17.582242_11_plen_191_part_00
MAHQSACCSGDVQGASTWRWPLVPGAAAGQAGSGEAASPAAAESNQSARWVRPLYTWWLRAVHRRHIRAVALRCGTYQFLPEARPHRARRALGCCRRAPACAGIAGSSCACRRCRRRQMHTARQQQQQLLLLLLLFRLPCAALPVLSSTAVLCTLRYTAVQGSTVPLLPPRAYNVYSCRRLLGEYSYVRQ